MANADRSGRAGHPKNIILLTADAFGVMPPIARLNEHQAMYHFLSGYTAKVAGTERGVKDPQATFSACFGAPFMPLHPVRYAELLREKIQQHNCKVWLVNTGWTGGPYGTGDRMKLAYTRAMVSAVLNSDLDDAETYVEPFFGLSVPTSINGIPNQVFRPRDTWRDRDGYDKQASKLADMFAANFQQFAGQVSEEVRTAGPS